MNNYSVTMQQHLFRFKRNSNISTVRKLNQGAGYFTDLFDHNENNRQKTTKDEDGNILGNSLSLDKNKMVHCTSPVGSMDGSIVVESESGDFSDYTTLQVNEV